MLAVRINPYHISIYVFVFLLIENSVSDTRID